MKQHGQGGVYVGGDWVELKDVEDLFLVKNGSESDPKCMNDGNCSTCPRSRSKHSSVKSDDTYDVIVIGAGCIGAAVARELSKTTASVLLLEAADDVTQGATKGNSGIVHAGFDDTPGTNRAKFCWRGNQMFEQLDKELHFGFQKNGSLVVAKTAEEMKHLYELKERGEKNGVKRLRVIDNKAELFKMEPYLHPDCIGALHSPDAGNLIPYEYTVALAENAVDNGVELRIRRKVKDITKADDLFVVKADYWEPAAYVESVNNSKNILSKYILLSVSVHVLLAAVFVSYGPLISTHLHTELLYILVGGGGSLTVTLFASFFLIFLFKDALTSSKRVPETVGDGGSKVSVDAMKLGGSGSSDAVGGRFVAEEVFRSRYVVNCAGSYSDKISAMIGDDSFKIKPRLGDYILLSRDSSSNQGVPLASHTIFPCPGPLGKGVLVQTTLWGNLILGPTARDMHLKEVASETAADIQKFIFTKCKELVPSFDVKSSFHGFCGARAKSTRGDWIIEPSSVDKAFIQVAGIDSPGLAGSPAIALEVVELLVKAGLSVGKNANFNPNRAPIIIPKNGLALHDGTKMRYTKEPGEKMDPRQNIVCKCEKVTEQEIVTALHRSLPIDSTQAIRKRTRAGTTHSLTHSLIDALLTDSY